MVPSNETLFYALVRIHVWNRPRIGLRCGTNFVPRVRGAAWAELSGETGSPPQEKALEKCYHGSTLSGIKGGIASGLSSWGEIQSEWME